MEDKNNGQVILRDADGNIIEGAVPKKEGDRKIEAERGSVSKESELDKIKEQNQEDLKKFKAGETETVTVNKKALDEMIRRLERLESVADVGRLGNYDDKNKKDPPKIVLLGVLSGKIVVGWKMLKDEVQKINGVWRESQLIQLKLEDDTTVDMPYLQYVQEVVKVDATISSRTKESNGHETLKVKRNDNGNEYLIDITFVNP